MFSVAIDGPSGVGKSTMAKGLAQKFGFIYVDTGALYRTVAVYLFNNNIDPKDEEKVKNALTFIDVKMKHMDDGQHVYLNDEDVTDKIRTPEISMIASTSSALPCVREFLLSLQRDMAKKYDVIMDGRDIGTTILPNSDIKIFLTASAEERAKRRLFDLKEKGIEDTFENVYKDVVKRDEQDSTRAISPLRQAEDAIKVDSTKFQPQETMNYLEQLIRSKYNAN